MERHVIWAAVQEELAEMRRLAVQRRSADRQSRDPVSLLAWEEGWEAGYQQGLEDAELGVERWDNPRVNRS